MNPQRGEVWWADLGMAAKPRPIVILSRNDPDRPRNLTIYVPVTKQNRGSKYEVELPRRQYLMEGSTANVQGLASGETSDKKLFEKKLGDLPADTMDKIEKALLFALGMGS